MWQEGMEQMALKPCANKKSFRPYPNISHMAAETGFWLEMFRPRFAKRVGTGRIKAALQDDLAPHIA